LRRGGWVWGVGIEMSKWMDGVQKREFEKMERMGWARNLTTGTVFVDRRRCKGDERTGGIMENNLIHWSQWRQLWTE
jgi:hypothetical protein